MLTESFYMLVAHETVIYTSAQGGSWLRPIDAYYKDEACMR